ncbi:MAG: protein translocase subunit SecF [Deferribacteraceae bacterium]|jgi:preprotein translocase subunit SecF|nr:protein translocase subunit SecF [Deferribacteraceae bacterium]
MMELIKPGTKIDFIGKLKMFLGISGLIVAIGLGVCLAKGFNLGIDFAGGTVVQVKFNAPIALDTIRKGLEAEIGSNFTLQNFGEMDEVLIRVRENPDMSLQAFQDSIKAALEAEFASYSPTIQRVEQVGPQVGDELKKKAYMAMIFSAIGILLYVAIRFQLFFGLSAIIALVHDIIFTLGIYSISGKEFSITAMAALLTVVGYSLNDKIVIFDRIREKLKAGQLAGMGWGELINKSINECLTRTVMTSLLTFLAAISLYIFGGEVINGFALIMMVGIVIGTYSSMGVAAMAVYLMRNNIGSKATKAAAAK